MSWKLLLFILCFRRSNFFELPERINKKCGIDFSPIEIVYEGLATVETYPWLGRLYYPISDDKVTTVVVLITRELVIGPAFDIDKYPKDDFRAKSKVVLGCNCSGPEIGVRNYIYHPDYKEQTLSAVAIIQLDILHLKIKLYPICVPPSKIDIADFYAMTVSRDCNNSTIKIFKMEYVDPEECRIFYRRSGLDEDNMWPTHTACARARSGGKCVWRNGAVLVLREDWRWRLVGIGVYGPGCETPARFLDYGMYHSWVRTSISNMGKPAVTRMGPNHLILRRSLYSVQRFGSCDSEETKAEIYTDETTVSPGRISKRRANYNLTLFANVDYSCIILHVSDLGLPYQPRISLKRWCSTPMPACYEFQSLQVDFFVEIWFTQTVHYKVSAYGREVRLIDRKAFMAYMNRKVDFPKPYSISRWWWEG